MNSTPSSASISATAKMLVTVVASCVILAQPAFAGHVEKVKDDQVLIIQDDSEPELNPGDRFFVLVDGKKRAAIQVTKAKGRRGIARVLKGKPEVNGALLAVADAGTSGGAGAAAPGSPEVPKKSSSRTPFNRTTIGVLAGANSATQSVTVTNANSSTSNFSTSGTGFSLKGFADIPLGSRLGMIGRAGFEQFSVKGSGASTSILYGTADLLVRYSLFSGSFRLFPELGLGLHVPLSKSSTDLDASQISATTLLFFGLGANYAITGNMYLQGLLEYCYFPPSSNVTTTLLAFRLGLGWRY
jgi:hypothetical protein